MNRSKRIAVFILVLVLIMPTMPVNAVNSTLACEAASVMLTAPMPDPGLVDGDISFTVFISVSGCAPGVAGAEIYVSYDPLLVEPPASPIGVAEALPDFFGASNLGVSELLPKEQCPGGTKPCVHLVVAGPAQTAQSGAAARFHFVGNDVGKACFTLLASTLVDGDGFDVPHIIMAPNPQCVDIVFRATVKGKVLRQGVPAIPNPGGGTWACSVVSAASGAGIYGPVFTDSMGNFTLPGLPPGTYELLAGYSGYLDSGLTIVISYPGPPVIDAGITTLHGGDVNDVGDVTGDGNINILDIGEILSEFGMAGFPVGSSVPAACGGPDESGDINDNGNININDLAIAAGNWGCTGPTPWGLVPPTRCIPPP